MSKVDIWMPIYIGDYLRDTAELSAEEHGAYFLLLMHYWQKNGEIGADVDRLARVARTQPETARFILGSYFILENGNYRNKRADEEIKNADTRRETARENGMKGGRPPKNNPKETGGLPGANLAPNPQESSSSSSSPSNSKKDNTSEKHKYGSESNVLLSDTQYRKLESDIGAPMLCACIEELSQAKAMKGYKYKRDDLAIRKWVIGAVKKKGVPLQASPAPKHIDLTLCPVCGTNERPTVRGCCVKCGFFLDPSWINDPEIVEEQKAAWLKASANA